MNRNEPAALAAADTLSERAAAWIEADILAGGSRPAAGSASRIRRRVTASARRRCARRFRGSPRAALSTRSANADFASSRFRARISPTSSAFALWSSGRRCASAWNRRRRLGRGNRRHAAPAEALYPREPARLRRGRAEFDALHKSFHTALIAACGSPRLLAAHSDLYDQTYRYRRLMMAKFADPEEFVRAHDSSRN